MKNSVRALGAMLIALSLPAVADVDPAPVLRAEYAFAAAASARGVRDAFLEYAASDAVLFRPRAVNAHEHLEAAPPIQSRLEWYPSFAVLATSRDLGFTTGPWLARPAVDAPAVAHGSYVTVWKRLDGGAWRFVIDHGISHEPAAEPPTALSAGTESSGDVEPVVFSERGPALDALAGVNDELDAALSQAEAAAGRSELYSDDVRVYREGVIPAIGLTQARALLESSVARGPARRRGIDVAHSGDFGYTWGYLSPAAPSPRTEHVYVRLWQRVSGEWRLLLDLETPLPPAGE